MADKDGDKGGPPDGGPAPAAPDDPKMRRRGGKRRTSDAGGLAELMQLQRDQAKGEKKEHWILSTGGSVTMSLVVLLNAIWMGIQTDMSARGILKGSDSERDFATDPFFYGENIFLVVFMLESALRFRAQGCRSFFSDRWNLMDLFFVIMGVADLLVRVMADSGEGGLFVFSNLRMLRILKIIQKVSRMLRVFRLVRLLRLLKELLLIAKGIVGAMRALQWTLMIQFSLLYIVAVVSTEFFGMDAEEGSDLKRWFGSLGQSFTTLFVIAAGSGNVFYEVMDTIREQRGGVWVLFWLSFHVFTNFVLLNVVIAVISDTVSITSAADNSIQNQAEMQDEEEDEVETFWDTALRLWGERADRNGDGSLNLKEFQVVLKDRSAMELMKDAVGIESRQELEEIFRICLNEETQEVDMSDFLEACQRFRGEAKAKSLLELTMLVRNRFRDQQREMNIVKEDFHGQSQGLRKRMAKVEKICEQVLELVQNMAREQAKASTGGAVGTPMARTPGGGGGEIAAFMEPTEKKLDNLKRTIFELQEGLNSNFSFVQERLAGIKEKMDIQAKREAKMLAMDASKGKRPEEGETQGFFCRPRKPC
mmetsp:Transcript_9541/g.21070  ORF Transcript_9541/g.21070 Transcript_9541/m.21070 type:complete len:592 (+) Transcript_9541:82-1857(+)